MEFETNHDVSLIELETTIAKLKSKLTIQEGEIEHLKKLLETYRSMPDIKNIIESLSNLAVPSIDKLKEFVSTIEGTKLDMLCGLLEGNMDAMRNLRRW